jgi:hypothetical protein
MLRFADLDRDTALLEWARSEAPMLLDQHPANWRRKTCGTLVGWKIGLFEGMKAMDAPARWI